MAKGIFMIALILAIAAFAPGEANAGCCGCKRRTTVIKIPSTNNPKKLQNRKQEDKEKLEDARAKEFAKAAYVRSKKIRVRKVTLPEGLNGVDPAMRIESLCGYDIGAVAKLPAFPKVDEEGNVVVETGLKKPFCLCDKARLKYSHINNALYSITLYSDANPDFGDDAAASEVSAMMDALSKKFPGQIKKWQGSSASIKAKFGGNAGQSLKVERFKADYRKPGTLKGPSDGKLRKEWAFSVTLEDDTIKNVDVLGGRASVYDAVKKDVDTL